MPLAFETENGDERSQMPCEARLPDMCSAEVPGLVGDASKRGLFFEVSWPPEEVPGGAGGGPPPELESDHRGPVSIIFSRSSAARCTTALSQSSRSTGVILAQRAPFVLAPGRSARVSSGAIEHSRRVAEGFRDTRDTSGRALGV